MESEEILKQKYLGSLPHFQRAGSNIVEALTIFLRENTIPFLAINYRVKEFSSFYEKVGRKKYSDAFIENEDFCGARIILYYQNDIDKVRELISEEFIIQENENKAKKLDLNEFGYRSEHFIVKFKNDWLSTPNYRGLDHIKIEIQVRTILMHAWAEIEHELGYKNKDQVPNELKRKLFMLSAKLEEADEQFQELKRNIEKYSTELIKDANKSGRFIFEEFNLESLQAMLDYYFPNLERNKYVTAELFNAIRIYQIPEEKVVEYAIRIKPYISLINYYVSGKKSETLGSQTNIMYYAIEVFHLENSLSRASESRKKIIKKLRADIKLFEG